MTNTAMQQLYQQIILDHAKARHGAPAEGLAPLDTAALPAGLRVTESHQVNTTCGDEVTVRIGLRGALRGVESAGEIAVGSAGEPADDAVIEEFVWAGDGCSISMASASVLHDSVRGESVESSRALLNTFREMLRSRGTIEPDEEVLGDAAAFSGVSRYPARVKCAMLPWVAFEAALLTE